MNKWDYNITKNEWLNYSISKQLKLLKKYYPIGETFQIRNEFLDNFSPIRTPKNINVRIKSYREIHSPYYACFGLNIEPLIENSIYTNHHQATPFKLKPLLRYINLVKLGI